MNSKTKNKREEILNAEEVVNILASLVEVKKYKKKSPSPKFNLREFYFIRDLIFWKPRGLVFLYIADHIMNHTAVHDIPMFNAPSFKKLQFLRNFFENMGNAKEAAIKAGYSPKTAKQQGHRILREIQGHKRNS
jgi:hypothetical protein